MSVFINSIIFYLLTFIVVFPRRIMILDDGVLSEMDTPSNLLANKEGVFRGLWDKHEHSTSGAVTVKPAFSSGDK